MRRVLSIKISDRETIEKIDELKKYFGFFTYTELFRYLVSEFHRMIKQEVNSK